ncbi:hypothetical protein [Acetobacter sicerae]|uniref:hypothetical protein n=1 Tax=Acetobacter sicerae TaxID=85325 RepID=UPI001F552C1B|nr:hypothetical protein [Acetobacter sicerae]
MEYDDLWAPVLATGPDLWIWGDAVLKPGVTASKDRVAEVMKAVKDLTLKRVMIGIPEEESARPDDAEASNALIGYVQETGCPERNIPARPFLVPGVQSVTEDAIKRLASAGKKALEGDAQATEIALNSIGLNASGAVKDKMDVGPFKPLADATLEARIRRGGGSEVGATEELERRKGGLPPSTDLAQPLIDTGNLQNSITYVIRDTRTRRDGSS